MKQYKFDVIIIGAGSAGVTAAGALAGAGISVALIESGAYAGAENWSGCVYFAENLAAEDCFGVEAVAQAPFERRVVRRGTLLHNGLDEIGVALTDPSVFRHCYTVLRPVYDPYFAHLARLKGAVPITGATVTSLIRDRGRVIGIETGRGPLYAEIVFIAEGDASHLVRAEGLERVPDPHFLQGVKAVLSLAPGEIEKRFNLREDEGAAYEIMIRNASLAGRTAKLNLGGFLYTNRDSLSLGYVVPLENLRNNYRGDHDLLFEWMRGLPYIKELISGAELSAYGTKIIRSGGWRERPTLVQDGLVVGGASAGLGVDLPFPNFTGPASATGLYFARAVKALLREGKPLDSKNLTRRYLDPMRDSVYGRNAGHLSAWPAYFSRSQVLFGRTIDVACGTAHFLSKSGLVETGRFLRSHILSLRSLRESITDTMRAVSALRLWKPLLLNAVHPLTLGAWVLNQFKPAPPEDARLGIMLNIRGEKLSVSSLPQPLKGLIRRTSKALTRALAVVYANDDVPVEQKLTKALQLCMRSLRLTDLVILPAYGLFLFLLALGTALWDAFRFYVLKTPVETLLREPVMAYAEAQKKARSLDAVKPLLGLDAKLAMNTYRPGTSSHIKTLWPRVVTTHADMAKAGLWWVCPARVYRYEAPLFGRGKVAVSYENCIKCESCWRAEPDRVVWGRHTDHGLIYRPRTAAMPLLLQTLKKTGDTDAGKHPEVFNDQVWYLGSRILHLCRTARNAASAFSEALAKLPASSDAGRQEWPRALGKRLEQNLFALETSLENDGRRNQAQAIHADRTDIEQRLAEGRLFQALYCCRRLDERLAVWLAGSTAVPSSGNNSPGPNAGAGLSSEDAATLFPDRIVKQWEEEPMPAEWSERLRVFIAGQGDNALECIRALSSINPALGLVAAHQLRARRVLAAAGLVLESGICALDGKGLDVHESMDSVRIKGVLSLVPSAASTTFLLLTEGKAHLVPLTAPGVTLTMTPAIGFRAAGLADLTLDCTVKKYAIVRTDNGDIPDAASYLAIALGAGDYLCKRIKEHAAGRVQFPGQMLDTEGRDGIAKLGAVKALIARTEAWRFLLETLHHANVNAEPRTPDSELLLSLLKATLAAMAFNPEPGAMGYDAGQVFGGFAYSEDDLLSRFYRDSSLFRFLAPGYLASHRLRESLKGRNCDEVFPELGSLTGIRTEPLIRLAQETVMISKRCSSLPPAADLALAGEACALSIALRAVLVRVEAGLNAGGSMELPAAAAGVLAGLAKEALLKADLSAGRGTVAPDALFPIEPAGSRASLDTDYETFCTATGSPHVSGAFLTHAFDRSPRFVPEMQLHDEKLRARWTELVDWFKSNCSEKPYHGLHLERHIEKHHRIPDEIIQAVKERKWLATTVPAAEDGLGWHKAEYYILNSAAGSFGDAGINLLIMASTSIGTTPVLLGLMDELPRVREELTPLAQDEMILDRIGLQLGGIVKSLASPNPALIKKEFESVMKLVDARIRQTRVVKYLAANFLRAFYGAGIAGKRGDFGGFTGGIRQAGELFNKLLPDVRAALDELPRRERCHRMFLKALGHNAISAFALTEPTAGSDSGGVRTTAKLHRSKLTELGDGRYSFLLDEQDSQSIRWLIDADRIVYTGQGLCYRTPDDQTVPIRFDRYDYATDLGVRFYVYRNQDCVFHDIGQVRPAETGFVYEYYRMTGSKMWITNGSVATQFCLYAQTPEGVTGFMVDRHAEGLKVGADEKKTGQRGSPTNEISIDNARVPRESVIGYEGHGQVNALETLNVGRCGLAVVSGALMRKLMREATRGIAASSKRDNLLGEAAAIMFGSESLAYYLVGLFDRPHESVRMESAIAKFACSEDIHELISLVEYAYGPEGQTEKFLLEKARRDSRILTIYEGTNEVQRFLIVKDLFALASRWSGLEAVSGDATAGTLAEWKNLLRSRVKETAALIGDAAWSDAMLQPAMFTLAEMAGEILRLECIFYRKEWLEKRADLLGRDYAASLGKAGARAAERTRTRLVHLDAKFSAAWDLVKNTLSLPEVLAADAALDMMTDKPAQHFEASRIVNVPVRILSILRPVAELSPQPALSDGTIQEILWRIDQRDLAGLSLALKLKADSSSTMVEVLMPGGCEHEMLLREATGGRADAQYRLQSDPTAAPYCFLKTVKDLEAGRPYDLIMVGEHCLNGDHRLAAYLAGGLKRRCRTHKGTDGFDAQGSEISNQPAIVGMADAAFGPALSLTDSAGSAFSLIRVVEGAPAAPVRFTLPVNAATAAPTITSIRQAAEYLKSFAASENSSATREFKGESIRGVLSNAHALWAVLDPRDRKSNLSVLRAARHVADLINKNVHTVIPAPRKSWPGLLGLAETAGCDQAFCIDTGEGRLSDAGKRELAKTLAGLTKTSFILAGTEWTNALASLAGELEAVQPGILLCSNATDIQKAETNGLLISLPAYEGKLSRHYAHDNGSAFITLSPETDFPLGEARREFKSIIPDFTLKPEWIIPLPVQSARTLAQADVIIDLGYGIRDQSGLALAQELKKTLEALGLAPLFGATRKVTQDLKLLPIESQIGQTGVRVNPKLVIALGISGAPQHLDYLGTRAEILCFNKDAEAPLMKLNQTRSAPRVHPIDGDLFTTLRELITELTA